MARLSRVDFLFAQGSLLRIYNPYRSRIEDSWDDEKLKKARLSRVDFLFAQGSLLRIYNPYRSRIEDSRDDRN
ncbi:hypothetical protein [Altibacter lentus]|uniref:hypothetical protein n=1 Tax=Altibacter lentus TaxID=1223410 RepID=UPI001268964F|nr:hypothetical protein [Altibacter lentus]